MLNLFRTKTFLKEYKKIKFTDKLYTKYVVYISTLLQKELLPPQALDHSLKGNYTGYREFHISGNLLVVYMIEDETLKLIRIGSHSEIFN
ncbi:MAG TPA: type II toxin-antitoxin system YafQ family toxin [Campylobacterales bacterium]|nr:type II toxin-antitoxin system YafQ family toxin [Campylobacterales bacterium]